MLLAAFVFNLFKVLNTQSRVYSAMNFIGAAICGYSSYLIEFYPFVVLEGIWAAFGLYSFFNVPRGTSN
ncbi:hypothetical protein D0C36_14105 [Mucilaginibacter conchicola]|uniref:CBU-0592-like domain-containing protein n=1 Tax=Mucilaginibacter conchicola TaxID=2303333 RepID=A0A372NUX8_9SPHI|nr:hypothetical protein D0C36_14105 [Mucilaginibacter conchicola]